MRLRVLVLPLAAAIIYGLCEYKLGMTYVRPRTDQKIVGIWRLAPSFEAMDINGRVFRLQRYIGRQAILLVFFDGTAGPEKDSRLQLLTANKERIDAKGLLVIAVSNALPQKNRQSVVPSNIKLVTDLDPLWAAHRIWNSFDEEAEKPIFGAFAIDRAGNTLATPEGTPIPIENLEEWLRR